MYGKHNEVRDGAITMALLLDLLSKTDKKLNQLVDELPSSFTAKDKIKCSKDEAKKVLQILKEQHAKVDTTEGIKIIFDKQNWLMVRPRGKEKIIRIAQ